MGVAGAVAGTFGIQPLVGAFGVPYQAAEPKDERQIRLVAQIAAKCHRVVLSVYMARTATMCGPQGGTGRGERRGRGVEGEGHRGIIWQ